MAALKANLKKYKWEIAIFLSALILRSLFLMILLNHFNNDLLSAISTPDGYYRISENLLKGNGFSIYTPPVPDSVRTPLYPLFMAGIAYLFKTYLAVAIIQILIGSGVAVLGYHISRYFLSSNFHRLIIGFLLA